MGLTLCIQQILWISFYFSTKAVISVRLLPYRRVFALFDMQFSERKSATGYFKLHRLLYFTRAVFCPLRQAAALPPERNKSYSTRVTAA